MAVVDHRRPYIGGLLMTGLSVAAGPEVRRSVPQQLRLLVVFCHSVVPVTGVSGCGVLYSGRAQLGGKQGGASRPVVCAALAW